MRHDFLDKYSDRDGPLHRADARVKIAAVAAVLVALNVLRAPPWYVGAAAAAGLVAAVVVARLPFWYVFRRAAKARREPFCIFCGYNLTGLPDRYRCPECGRPYTWQLIAEYRRDPAWFRERWRLHRELPPADAPFEAGPVQRRRKDGT